jgi:O-antigen/teichoic acid export membrane protein
VRAAAKVLSLGGNTIWLTAARIAPMVTGLVFWALAALLLVPAELGLASAVVAAALLTVQIGMLGVGPATLTLLPAETEGRRLVTTSLLTVGLSSLIVATGLLITTRALGPGVGQAWDDPVAAVAFLAAAFFATTAYQLDHIHTAQCQAHVALVRSVLQSLVQLTVLAICLASGYRSLNAVVGAVAAGAAASVILGLLQVYRVGPGPLGKNALQLREILDLLRPALRHYPLMLADRAPGYVLPLIIAATLGSSATGAWYVVWMLSAAVFFVPQSAGYSLQTKLSSPGHHPGLVVRALRISLLLTLAAGGILLGASPYILKMLGSQYASHWVLLTLLVPGLVLTCVTQIYYGVCRARGRLAEATAIAVLAAAIAVVPAATAAHLYALPGVSVLWLAAQLAAALIAAWRLRYVHARLGNPQKSGPPAHSRRQSS